MTLTPRTPDPSRTDVYRLHLVPCAATLTPCACPAPCTVRWPRYLHGLGLEKNLPIAFDLLSKAAEVGNAEALYNLGMMYLSVSACPGSPRFVEPGSEERAGECGLRSS